MSSPEYSTARLRLAILFSIPLAFSLIFFLVNISAEHNDTRIINLQTLQGRLAALRNIANDAEVGEHGFLLTSDDRYLVTLESATRRLGSEEKTIADSRIDRDLQPAVDRLVTLVSERVRNANDVIRIQQENGLAAAVDAAHNGDGQVLMREIREQTELLQSTVGKRTQGFLDYSHHLTRGAFLVFLFATLTMLLVLMWLYNAFSAHIEARDTAHAQLRVLNADLEKLNADLERRIDERTKELSRFNEELQQFAYVASHDLQEPLRTITSFTQLLATRYAGKLDADADEFIGYIVSSSRRMTDLINGLLALVRLRKSGQATAPVPLAELIAEAEISLQAAIRENAATVRVQDLPELIVDRLQFTQVFQNLMSNAIKYRGEASPVVTISAQRDQSNWIVSLADNGRGFDQEFAERIFGIFQRLHGREVEGTGMGLSIARRIVERHGGRMWAESSEGVGSTFFISLPVSLEAKAAEDTEVKAAPRS
jgi:signal transduction histidine kinase